MFNIGFQFYKFSFMFFVLSSDLNSWTLFQNRLELPKRKLNFRTNFPLRTSMKWIIWHWIFTYTNLLPGCNFFNLKISFRNQGWGLKTYLANWPTNQANGSGLTHSISRKICCGKTGNKISEYFPRFNSSNRFFLLGQNLTIFWESASELANSNSVFGVPFKNLQVWLKGKKYFSSNPKISAAWYTLSKRKMLSLYYFLYCAWVCVIQKRYLIQN